jgi:hypothetical protein
MFSGIRTMALAGTLAVAFVGGVRAGPITYTIGSFFQVEPDGSGFNVCGTNFPPGFHTLDLIPGISQTSELDDCAAVAHFPNSGVTFTGTAISNMTINGITGSVSDDFTFNVNHLKPPLILHTT